MKKLFTYSLILLASFQFAKADHLSGNLTLSAKLDGTQETPSVVTNALGVSSFVLNSTRDTLCIHASVNGLSGAVTGAHIHSGAAGISGGVVVDLTSFVSGNNINATISGSALTTELISSMLSGGNYLNVHTAANPNGEIRGQIYLETDYQYTAMLDGSQEVPSVVTSAYGLGSFNLYKNQEAITINVVVQGLSGIITGAHFHVGAPGVSGGVVEDLTSMVTGNVIVGEVDPALYLSDLLAGNIYINIHTSANPNGEIRGQVITDTKLAFDATIDGTQEVPAVVTSALGVAVAKLNTAMDTMWYHVVADGLSGAITGAHFHAGKKGVSGGVVVDLSAGISGNKVDGMITGTTLTSDLIKSFLTGGIYVNLHTTANPNGEIRGQVYRYAREGYTFTMDGGQEVPSTTATATGSGIITIDRDQENAHIMIVLSGLTGPITGAHIHNNVAGENGGVLFDLTDWFSQSGIDDAAFGYWTDEDATPFSSTIGKKFIGDSIYLNVHTPSNPNGEIRGQTVRGADCFQTVVGIASIADNILGFSLYPNPSSEMLHVNFESLTSSDISIQVVDLTGRIISQSNNFVSKGKNDLEITVTSLEDGIYFLRVLSNDHSQVIGKFIKE